jgi:hypothetical protein
MPDGFEPQRRSIQGGTGVEERIAMRSMQTAAHEACLQDSPVSKIFHDSQTLLIELSTRPKLRTLLGASYTGD